MALRPNIKQRVRDTIDFLKFKILHVDDSPAKIARGVAIGLFIAWSPFLGLHILLTIFFSLLLRANKVVALAFVWVCNVFTLIPIYYPSYLLGKFVAGFFREEEALTSEEFEQSIERIYDIKSIFLEAFTRDFWKEFSALFMKIGLELTIGGFILGFVIATVGYVLSYRFVVSCRAQDLGDLPQIDS